MVDRKWRSWDDRMGIGQKSAYSFPSIPFSTAREWDGETGLYYYRARYYDAGTGRFVSEDPILKKNIDFIGYNLLSIQFYIYTPQKLLTYQYCSNNPIKYIDPNGLTWWDPTSWNDTNYGGWTKSGPGPITSSLDACYKNHDECLKQNGKCWQLWKEGVKNCHKILVTCVAIVISFGA